METASEVKWMGTRVKQVNKRRMCTTKYRDEEGDGVEKVMNRRGGSISKEMTRMAWGERGGVSNHGDEIRLSA